MRKNLLLLITAVLLSMASAFAQGGTTGPLTWELSGTAPNLTLTISGEGEMPDYEYESSPWYDYRESITTVVLENGITTIGVFAFQNCSAFISINIPNSIVTIGNYAFPYCTALTSITLGNSIAYIGYYAFENCTALTSITIPSSVTTIGDNTFHGCTALTSIDVENENANYSSIDGVLLSKEKTNLLLYPSGKTNSSYIIPNSVIGISYDAFRFCTKLTSITIPNSVSWISTYFFGCSALTSINVESENANYSSIDGVLFDKEKTILIRYPSGKINIGYTIPNSVTNIREHAFSECTVIMSITIPNTVTTIEYCAFQSCTALTSINIPNSVTIIRDGTFANCSALVSITLPNSVTTIEGFTFSFCSNLTSIIIPKHVASIGDYAFSRCTALTSVTNLNPEPIEISSAVFSGVEISACTLKVLESSIGAYQDAPVWQDFKIEGIVGIEDYKMSVVEVYPNPTSGVLRITSAESQVTGIEIFDISGRKLPTSSVSLKSLETLIDVSHLTAGFYFLKINTEAGQVIKKVLKE